MDFEHEGQQACYEKVVAYMTQLYGEAGWASPDTPSFELASGSAFVRIDVDAVTPPHAAVSVYSVVVTEAEDSEELYRYLLTENSKLRFGAFMIPEQGTIVLQHSVLGDTLDKEELAVSVDSVLQSADDYDDEIIGRFGGLRARDRSVRD